MVTLLKSKACWYKCFIKWQLTSFLNRNKIQYTKPLKKELLLRKQTIGRVPSNLILNASLILCKTDKNNNKKHRTNSKKRVWCQLLVIDKLLFKKHNMGNNSPMENFGNYTNLYFALFSHQSQLLISNSDGITNVMDG